MENIFICYSRTEQNFALELKETLEKTGKEAWIDLKHLPASSIWRKEIEEAITGSIAFIYLVSENSLRSDYCQKEFEYAQRLNKRIFPILLPGMTDKDVPESISSRQWLLWSGFGETLSNVDKLITDIETDHKWVKFITNLGVEEFRWREDKDNSRLLHGRKLQEAEQQLTSSGTKDPQPTDLQHQFVSESRKAEQRRQKTITRIVIGVSTIVCLLSIVAIAGGSIAYIQNKAAATAQLQVTEQKNISDTRQLANIANSLSLEQGDTAILSGLLAVEASRRYPELDSDQALRNFLRIAAVPISEMRFEKYILSIDFSPNGKWVAAASTDGKTQVWNGESGQEVIQLLINSSYVKFSPNGKWLVTLTCEDGGKDMFDSYYCRKNAAIIWDTDSWQEVSKMTNGDFVNSVVFSDDSKWVGSGGANNIIAVWEASTGKELPFTIHTNEGDYVSVVDFSPDGKLVVSGSAVGAIVWDIATGHQITQMVHDGEVHFTSFSPDSKWIISGGFSNSVIVWDSDTGEVISRLALDQNSVAHKGFFSPDGKFAAVQSRDTQGKDFTLIWNPQTGQEVLRTSGEVISFSPDSQYIFTGGSLAKVWDVKTGTESSRMVFDGNALAFNSDGTRVAFVTQQGMVYIKEFPPNQEAILMRYENVIHSVIFNPNGNWIAYASQDGKTGVWDIFSKEEVSQVKVDGIVVDVDFSSDGKWIAQGSCEGTEGGKLFCPKPTVRIWDSNTGKEIYNLKLNYVVGAIKFVPDNKRIITSGQHGNIELWDLSTEKILTKFHPTVEYSDDEGYPGSFASFIGTVDVDSMGQFIVAGIYKTVQVWDLESGREIYKLTMDGRITSVVFSPDGKWIASTDNASIRIWNPENGNELLNIPLNPFTGRTLLSFSPDGKWIMGNDENSIRVWEMPTGREISRITTSLINSLDFSPDGKWILSGGNDNAIRMWLWRPEDLIAEACARLPRNLTFAEWKQYIGDEQYKPTCENLPIPTE